MRRPRFLNAYPAALLALCSFALSTAHAGPVTITISGTWGTVTTGPGLATTPFDNSAFSFTTTVTSLTPTSFNSGETQLPTAGGSYTDGSTVPLADLEQLVLTDPSAWNGQDLGFGVHDVYFTGDFLELDFNGPQLYGGTTDAPTLSPTSFPVQESWYGFSARYFNGVGYSTVVLNGDATLTIAAAPVPEPSPAIPVALSLLPAIVFRRLWKRGSVSR